MEDHATEVALFRYSLVRCLVDESLSGLNVAGSRESWPARPTSGREGPRCTCHAPRSTVG